jgi:hypothetical protein
LFIRSLVKKAFIKDSGRAPAYADLRGGVMKVANIGMREKRFLQT